MAETMIDRVAYAVQVADDEVGICAARVIARAAIEAMREPTGGMQDAGNSAYHDNDRSIGAAWRAMIDKALAEG